MNWEGSALECPVGPTWRHDNGLAGLRKNRIAASRIFCSTLLHIYVGFSLPDLINLGRTPAAVFRNSMYMALTEHPFMSQLTCRIGDCAEEKHPPLEFGLNFFATYVHD